MELPKVKIPVFNRFRQFGKGVTYIGAKERSLKPIGVGSLATLMALSALYIYSTPSIQIEKEGKQKNSDQIDIGLLPENSVDYTVRKKVIYRARKVVRYQGLEKVIRPGLDNVPPGLTVEAVLLSGASEGPVRAKLNEPLSFNGNDVLPLNTMLIGEASQGKHRVEIKFNQILHSDGGVQSTNAVALDSSDKNVGLKASKTAYYAVKFGATAGLHFLSGVSEGFKQKDVKDGVVIDKPSFKNSLLQGASRAGEELSNQSLSEMKSNPPHMKVEAGSKIFVLFN